MKLTSVVRIPIDINDGELLSLVQKEAARNAGSMTTQITEILITVNSCVIASSRSAEEATLAGQGMRA